MRDLNGREVQVGDTIWMSMRYHNRSKLVARKVIDIIDNRTLKVVESDKYPDKRYGSWDIGRPFVSRKVYPLGHFIID